MSPFLFSCFFLLFFFVFFNAQNQTVWLFLPSARRKINVVSQAGKQKAIWLRQGCGKNTLVWLRFFFFFFLTLRDLFFVHYNKLSVCDLLRPDINRVHSRPAGALQAFWFFCTSRPDAYRDRRRLELQSGCVNIWYRQVYILSRT